MVSALGKSTLNFYAMFSGDRRLYSSRKVLTPGTRSFSMRPYGGSMEAYQAVLEKTAPK